MKNKLLLISCCCLTAIVVGVAGRIEYLNIKSNHFLPRNEVAVREWVIPELEEVLERLENKIYERRQDAAAAAAHESGSKPAEVVFGPPYSASEQKTLDSMKNLHASHTLLRWWVGSFGIAQYFLAPIALIAAIVCVVAFGGWRTKSTAAFCAGLNGISILLMLTRNYWNA